MKKDIFKKETEEFFKTLQLMNVLFPLFVTVIAVFFYVLGIGPVIILGAVLLILMGYNIIMAHYSYQLQKDIEK